MAPSLSFYVDEHIHTAIVKGLRTRGIDVGTPCDAGLLGASDEKHLAFACKTGRVLITRDQDSLALNAAGTEHPGIAFAARNLSIGAIVRALVLLHARLRPHQMLRRVEYLSQYAR